MGNRLITGQGTILPDCFWVQRAMEMPIGNAQLLQLLTELWSFSKLLQTIGCSQAENSTLGEYGIRVSSLDCTLQFGHIEAPMIQQMARKAFHPGSLDRTLGRPTEPGPSCP